MAVPPLPITHQGGDAAGGGAPSGAAGGDLSGTYPDPEVQDDSHSHTAATLPATMPPSAHNHDGDTLATLAQLDVDSLRLDGNSIVAIDANGNILLTPNGTGVIQIGGTTGAFAGLKSAGASGVLRAVAADASAPAILDAGRFRAQPTIGSAPNVLLNEATGMELASGKTIDWSSTSNAEGGKDLGFARPAPGVLRVTDGSTGIGKVEAGRIVEASTATSAAPNLLTAVESRKLLTNEGATEENFHELPTAAAGVGPFGFYCHNTFGIRAVAKAGDTVRIEATASATGGFIKSTVVGSLIWLECINDTEWVASHKPAGTWTIDS